MPSTAGAGGAPSSAIARHLIARLTRAAPAMPQEGRLTARETEVLRLSARATTTLKWRACSISACTVASYAQDLREAGSQLTPNGIRAARLGLLPAPADGRHAP
jgi:hypothetical protein